MTVLHLISQSRASTMFAQSGRASLTMSAAFRYTSTCNRSFHGSTYLYQRAGVIPMIRLDENCNSGEDWANKGVILASLLGTAIAGNIMINGKRKGQAEQREHWKDEYLNYSKQMMFQQQYNNSILATSVTRRDNPGLHLTGEPTYPKEILGPNGIPSRSEQICRLTSSTKEEPYDMLVIGGGATGSGIAFDAATRGLSVACIERGDFASETSSRSKCSISFICLCFDLTLMLNFVIFGTIF